MPTKKTIFEKKEMMANLRNILLYFLGATFLFSAYTKAVAPGFFEVLLEQQGIVPNRWYGAWFTRAIIALEIWLGISMFLSIYIRKTLRISFWLLVLFSAHLGYLIFVGNDENCGCFGEMIKMTPTASLTKNLGLLLINGFLLRFRFRSEKKSWLIWGLPPLLFIATVLILPIQAATDDIVKKIPSFDQNSEIDLTKGEYVVAVLNLSCEHCQAAAQELAQLQNKGVKLPKVVALFFEEGDTSVEEFNTLTQSDFPYQMIDVNTFFALIGSSPPRVYWIKNGTVKQFWDQDIASGIQTTFAP